MKEEQPQRNKKGRTEREKPQFFPCIQRTMQNKKGRRKRKNNKDTNTRRHTKKNKK